VEGQQQVRNARINFGHDILQVENTCHGKKVSLPMTFFYP